MRLFEGMATAVPQIGPEMAVWAGSHQLTVPIRRRSDACSRQAIGTFIQYMLDNSVTWSRAGQIPASNTVRQSSRVPGSISPQAQIRSLR
jgi:multiple sugar transport system substrate-binding protein